MMNGSRPARFRRLPGCALALLLCALPAAAAEWLLAAADHQAVPGRNFELVVVGGAGEDASRWPQRLPATIELPGAGPRIALQLVAIGPVEAGAAQRRYFARWPMEVTGVVRIVLDEHSSARLLVDARADTQRVEPAAVQAEQGLDPLAPVAAVAPDAAPVEPSAIGFHEPMYFLVGGKDPTSARFQFSFRYRIFDAHGAVAEKIPVARGLYFGFTQTSLWDLESESKPFRDSSFRPSMFYRLALDDPDRRGSLALYGGYEHESNGQEDRPSRSIDTLFLRADARLRLDDRGTYLGIAPKLWTYLDREDNPDIARYRGYGELGLRLGRDDGLMFSTLLRRGTAGKMGAQYDLSYPIRRSVFSGVGAFVHVQAYKGYGETLLEYDENKETQFRVGVSLVR